MHKHLLIFLRVLVVNRWFYWLIIDEKEAKYVNSLTVSQHSFFVTIRVPPAQIRLFCLPFLWLVPLPTPSSFPLSFMFSIHALLLNSWSSLVGKGYCLLVTFRKITCFIWGFPGLTLPDSQSNFTSGISATLNSRTIDGNFQ